MSGALALTHPARPLYNKTMSKQRIELLAPAGGVTQLIAAVENGADAVYLGGRLFNARMNAGNFDDETMQQAIDYAHQHGVAVHVTLNTLLREEELPEALKYAAFLYAAGVDALIIQDLGLAKLIHQFLVIHVFAEGLDIRVDTGGVEDTQLRDIADLGRGGSRYKGNIAVLHALHKLKVCTQCRICVDLNLHFSAAQLADIIRESLGKDISDGFAGTAGGQGPGECLLIFSAAHGTVDDGANYDRDSDQLPDSFSTHNLSYLHAAFLIGQITAFSSILYPTPGSG